MMLNEIQWRVDSQEVFVPLFSVDLRSLAVGYLWTQRFSLWIQRFSCLSVIVLRSTRTRSVSVPRRGEIDERGTPLALFSSGPSGK